MNADEQTPGDLRHERKPMFFAIARKHHCMFGYAGGPFTEPTAGRIVRFVLHRRLRPGRVISYVFHVAEDPGICHAYVSEEDSRAMRVCFAWTGRFRIKLTAEDVESFITTTTPALIAAADEKRWVHCKKLVRSSSLGHGLTMPESPEHFRGDWQPGASA